MKNKLYCAGIGLIVGVAIAGIAWAQRYDSLIDWIAQQKVNDSTKAWALVVRDIGRLADSYTTITDSQKFAGLLKFSEAVCSGTRPGNIATYLGAGEQANARIVWDALKVEWKSQDTAQDTAQESIFDGEW